MQLAALISNYIPTDKVQESKHKMFGVLYDLLCSGIEDSISGSVLDNLFSFTSHKDDVEKVVNWVQKGTVFMPDGTTELKKLTASHKRAIMKRLFKSGELTQEKKNSLLEEILGSDNSDLAKNAKHCCAASIATAENKEKVWNELLDPNSKYSAKERQAMMGGFYSFDQLELCRPYYNKFYECLQKLEQEHGYKYMNFFFFSMLPRMEIDDSHIVQLMTIKSQVPDTNGMFMNIL